jgi:hypothetical protein
MSCVVVGSVLCEVYTSSSRGSVAAAPVPVPCWLRWFFAVRLLLLATFLWPRTCTVLWFGGCLAECVCAWGCLSAEACWAMASTCCITHSLVASQQQEAHRITQACAVRQKLQVRAAHNAPLLSQQWLHASTITTSCSCESSPHAFRCAPLFLQHASLFPLIQQPMLSSKQDTVLLVLLALDWASVLACRPPAVLRGMPARLFCILLGADTAAALPHGLRTCAGCLLWQPADPITTVLRVLQQTLC